MFTLKGYVVQCFTSSNEWTHFGTTIQTDLLAYEFLRISKSTLQYKSKQPHAPQVWDYFSWSLSKIRSTTFARASQKRSKIGFLTAIKIKINCNLFSLWENQEKQMSKTDTVARLVWFSREKFIVRRTVKRIFVKNRPKPLRCRRTRRREACLEGGVHWPSPS